MKNKIFAIDENDKSKVIKYVKALKKRNRHTDDIFAIKIGLKPLLDNGLSIIKKIKKISDLDIICDLKLAEIPSLSGEIAARVYSLGADGIIVQGFVGEKVIDQIYEKAPGLKIYVVSEMTHNDGGFTSKHLEDFANMAKRKQVFGIIGPGNRPDNLQKIKDIVQSEVKVIAAGIGAQGGEEANVIRHGADYLIEGSKIRKELEGQINQQLKRFSIEVALYFASGVILGIVFLFVTNYLKIITNPPYVNIWGPITFGIISSTIRIFIVKNNE